MLDFDFPHFAFVVEGRGDGAEDALQFHKKSVDKRGGRRYRRPGFTPKTTYFAMKVMTSVYNASDSISTNPKNQCECG